MEIDGWSPLAQKKNLAFDPTVSPHYQLFLVPYYLSNGTGDVVDPLVEGSEWPPTTCILNVYSSRSRLWEVRSFAREGKAAGLVAKQRGLYRYGAVCWRQALYVHSPSNFVMRLFYVYSIYYYLSVLYLTLIVTLIMGSFDFMQDILVRR
jgi:hypothetical protein